MPAAGLLYLPHTPNTADCGSSRRSFFAGIGRAGAGSRERGQGAQRLIMACDMRRTNWAGGVATQQHRPAVAHGALSPSAGHAGRSQDHKTGDAAALAPCRVPSLLALEIATARR